MYCYFDSNGRVISSSPGHEKGRATTGFPDRGEGTIGTIGRIGEVGRWKRFS